MSDFAPDTFTENDVMNALDRVGKKFKNGSRYILAQCPTHEDEHPSVQIYKDDWFVNCHAGCGRYHITKAYPELRDANAPASTYQPNQAAKKVSEHHYKEYDLMEFWKSLPMIPRDHEFKTIPLDILDDLGWRYVPDKNQYFIPYFSRSKESIPFAQFRNLGEHPNPRFIFLKDAKPTCYGTWNLYPGEKIFVCEGASDAAVLDYCAVPWIALPSASSAELMKSMAKFAVQNDIELVYAGDNDDAGDKLLAALDETAPYRLKQPPKEYKDWGDFLEGAGYDAVVKYCHRELFPRPEDLSDPRIPVGIRELWADAEVYEGEVPDFNQNESTPEKVRSNQGVLPVEF